MPVENILFSFCSVSWFLMLGLLENREVNTLLVSYLVQKKSVTVVISSYQRSI